MAALRRGFNNRRSSVSPPDILHHAPGLPPQPEPRCSLYSNILPILPPAVLNPSVRIRDGFHAHPPEENPRFTRFRSERFDKSARFLFDFAELFKSDLVFSASIFVCDVKRRRVVIFFCISLIILNHSNVFSSTY